MLLLAALTPAFSQQTDSRIIVNADQGEHTISRQIYGHFAEHLGRCVYGGFYVGEDNTDIPNTNGIRNDVIKALKELKVPNLRWPGGCFADTYHWKDGIGPKADRPTIVNVWWGGVTEDNSFGTHDFLNMCEMLDAEPYLAANVGSGEVQELIDWVQYVNHGGVSPMSDLRKENGREEPWGVKYWGVGNEAWGCGGNMTPEYYADVYKKYATFMSTWRNEEGIFRIASGASSGDYKWTEVLMQKLPPSLVEGLALHHYSVIDWNNKGPATGFSEEQYFTTMQRALHMEELVTRHSTIMDKYDPDQRIALVVDEWGGWYNVEPGTNPGFLYQQNTMRDAMIAGTTLNIFHNHADRVRMANLAQTINVLQAVLLTDEEKMILTPTYHVMKMYNVHQDAQLLPLTLQNVDYELNGQKLPAISASASKDADGNVHVSLVNIDAKNARTVSLTVRGTEKGSVSGTILQSANLSDHNTFDNPDKIAPKTFRGFQKNGDQLTVTLPPFSVVVLAVE
ncbi:alpha-N-arabinofuranosidase [Flavilitoribacter nigricans DSM 23189 = NBRC 102662]|uniref:non-reducing end alpha-L-arabinofuranosidase n=2 Tax=Flavilitoribacter TaxID=2762562 RepID=A0A2D0N626_FLAN2|nr:alpha-N-arabinofuranosidase [Flavilitoribacter nigricans DSM 23189 = NBRC 102662]